MYLLISIPKVESIQTLTIYLIVLPSTPDFSAENLLGTQHCVRLEGTVCLLSENVQSSRECDIEHLTSYTDRRKAVPRRDPAPRKPPSREQGGLFGHVPDAEPNKDEQEEREGSL